MPYKPMIQFKPGELRRLQDAAGYTNPKIANKLKIAQGTWDRWLATGRVPRERYEELCATLNIEPAAEPLDSLSPLQESQLELLRREVRQVASDQHLILEELRMIRAATDKGDAA